MTAGSVEAFRSQAQQWLSQTAAPRDDVFQWGEGSPSVALFHGNPDEEKRSVNAYRDWIRCKSTAGYHGITWDREYGGLGLTSPHARAFDDEEAMFLTPPAHDAVSITRELIAPTIRVYGTDEQRQRFIRDMLRADVMWCQMFSEPGAGSDLAGLATRAKRDGTTWVLEGQKVWTSGAQFAEWGYILCRTDPAAPKHRGITAFLVPMDQAGITIKPLRQMTGGSSFNEVFFEGVRIDDDLRLGPEGEGWRVALTTLGFERSASSGEGLGPVADRMIRVLSLATYLGVTDDPLVRQKLADLWIDHRVMKLHAARVKGVLEAGLTPGPEGSIGKLMWTNSLTKMSDVVSHLLGPRLTADTGEWGTYAWAEHVLGAPGTLIAGGSDQIQRTIIGERILALPPEPRVTR